jgi:hypothetical protein
VRPETVARRRLYQAAYRARKRLERSS